MENNLYRGAFQTTSTSTAIDENRVYVSREMNRAGVLEWVVDDLTRAIEDPCGFGVTVYRGPSAGAARRAAREVARSIENSRRNAQAAA